MRGGHSPPLTTTSPPLTTTHHHSPPHIGLYRPDGTTRVHIIINMTASTATHTPKSAKSRGPQPCIGKPIRSAVAHYDKVLAPKFKEHREASDLTIDAKALLKPSNVESIVARLRQQMEDDEKDQRSIKKQVSTLRDPPIPDVLQQEQRCWVVLKLSVASSPVRRGSRHTEESS